MSVYSAVVVKKNSGHTRPSIATTGTSPIFPNESSLRCPRTIARRRTCTCSDYPLESERQMRVEDTPVLCPKPSNALYGTTTRSVILSASVPSPEPHTMPTRGPRRCSGRSSASFTMFLAEGVLVSDGINRRDNVCHMIKVGLGYAVSGKCDV
jgi:hypothetical protein